jgi:hypothetical protein
LFAAFAVGGIEYDETIIDFAKLGELKVGRGKEK